MESPFHDGCHGSRLRSDGLKVVTGNFKNERFYMSLKIGSQNSVQQASNGLSQASSSGKFGQILDKTSNSVGANKQVAAGTPSNAMDQFRALLNKGASPQELVKVALQNNPLLKNAPNLRAQVLQGVSGTVQDSPLFRKV